MRNLIILSLIFTIIFLFGCKDARQPNDKSSLKDGVFVHISHGSDDVHRVLMGLQMAAIMSENQDVAVYFDIKGIEVVLKEAENLTYSHFPGSQEQIKLLLSRGVLLMACPGCLKAADKTADDLMDGIKVANKDSFFNFTSGRILTIDY